MTSDDIGFAGACVAVALFVCVLVAYFYVVSNAHAECEARGGHTVALYKDWICVSADGRILQ